MDRKHREILQLILRGFVLIVVSFGLLRNAWTPNRQLAQVRGHLRSVNVYVSAVPGRFGGQSHKSELIFFLNDGKQKYQLTENIGGDSYDRNYARIRWQLEKADSITVWIRKTEKNDWQPTVFQIKCDDKITVSADDIRKQEGQEWLIPNIVGLLLIILGLLILYPEKAKQIIANRNK